MISFRNGMTAFALVAGVLASGVASQAQVPVLEFTTIGLQTQANQNLSLGWSFTTNGNITVTGLDAYDPSGTGLVQLYNGAGQVLASATVTTAGKTVGSPIEFYSAPITPVVLTAGNTYYIDEDIVANTTYEIGEGSGISTNPLISYLGSVSDEGLGKTPTSEYPGSSAYDPGFFGPNFEITTPEPGSLALVFGAGVTCVGALARRRRMRMAAK